MGPKSGVAVAPLLSDPPKWMVADCEELSPWADRTLKQKELEAALGNDLEDYEDCRIRHASLRNFYRNRDARLRKELAR